MRIAGLALLAALVSSAGAAQQRQEPPTQQAREAADRALARWTSPQLTRFASEAEFRAYLADARAAARARGMWWSDSRQIQFAQAAGTPAVQSDAQQPACTPATPEACPEDVLNELPANSSVVVTGSRIRSPNLTSISPVTTVSGQSLNPAITNTQEIGVDEGDIVKQIGQFLLILQDGRIFVVDTRARDGRRLALTDRVNVYRDRGTGAWYDEMLVQGDRVLVTAYSYAERASELSVFQLDRRGRLRPLGVFYMSSNDYYSADNYATRLVGDSLVVYTPMWLQGVRPDSPIPWPLIRRWTPGETREAALARGVRLFDATTIYRPVRTSYQPVIHTVSVCPLGAVGEGRDLSCRATAFVGPAEREYYVSPTAAYLWITPGYPEDNGFRENRPCPAGHAPGPGDSTPALLYRLPISGEPPSVAGTAGVPIDQFSLAEIGGNFHALLRMPARCQERNEGPQRLTYFSAPLARLGRALIDVPAAGYVPVPPVGDGEIENRFTEDYLIYGGRSTWDLGAAPEDEDDRRAKPSTVVAVPVGRPQSAVSMTVPHSVIRAERAGNNIVLTGYRGPRGLEFSLVNLRMRPRVSSTVRLEGRFESEGRSHAFNSLIEADGSGLMGLPTVARSAESGRYWWRSQASDLSFLRVNAAGRLSPIGELRSEVIYDTRNDQDGIAGYECEVSCIDWYGNSRPIFTDGRIFGLTGTELIEGRVINGRIVETRRINIALESTRLRADQ